MTPIAPGDPYAAPARPVAAGVPSGGGIERVAQEQMLLFQSLQSRNVLSDSELQKKLSDEQQQLVKPQELADEQQQSGMMGALRKHAPADLSPKPSASSALMIEEMQLNEAIIASLHDASPTSYSTPSSLRRSHLSRAAGYSSAEAPRGSPSLLNGAPPHVTKALPIASAHPRSAHPAHLIASALPMSEEEQLALALSESIEYSVQQRRSSDAEISEAEQQFALLELKEQAEATALDMHSLEKEFALGDISKGAHARDVGRAAGAGAGAGSGAGAGAREDARADAGEDARADAGRAHAAELAEEDAQGRLEPPGHFSEEHCSQGGSLEAIMLERLKAGPRAMSVVKAAIILRKRAANARQRLAEKRAAALPEASLHSSHMKFPYATHPLFPMLYHLILLLDATTRPRIGNRAPSHHCSSSSRAARARVKRLMALLTPIPLRTLSGWIRPLLSPRTRRPF